MSLNLENLVLSPMARKVNEKNAVLMGSVPKVTTGATALAPDTTEGYERAIVDNMREVARYPKTNLGNLYHNTPNLSPVFVFVFVLIFVVVVI